MSTEVARLIGKVEWVDCPKCHGSGYVWSRPGMPSGAAWACLNCPPDAQHPARNKGDGCGKVRRELPYTVDDLLAWLASVGSLLAALELAVVAS